MKRILLSAFSAVMALAFTSIGAYAHMLPEDFSGFEDPDTCKGCHAQIYEEWAGSMHANSSKFSDPVHSAVHDAFSKALEAKGKKGNYHCANCHMPTAGNIVALMKGEAAPDPADATHVRGVTCSFCHKVESVVEGDKFHSYAVSEGIKGKTEGSPAPHGVTVSAFASSYKMCLGCHGKKINNLGGVICSMEEEGVSDCLSCHMETTGGAPAEGSARTSHAHHGICGAHDAAMLQRGANVSLSAEGRTLTVTLANPNPHYFPSTNPLRVAYLRVEAFDAQGETVFANFASDPSEDPAAMLIKLFGAGERVGVPSWEAQSVARDTRLKPGEERELSYELPEGAVRAAAKLFYRFVPGKAVEGFGIPKDGVHDVPALVSEADIEL